MAARTPKANTATSYKWEWKTRFRRAAFGFESAPAINRIKQAVCEIKKVARTDHLYAAEGSVSFLERLALSLERVDDSAGRLGSAVCQAIDELVSIIASADVKILQRRKWLDRLWQAYIEDEKPSIEMLGDHWGELCQTTEIASQWADQLIISARESWQNPKEREYFRGTTACLSALYKAQRDEELFSLLKMERHKLWDYHQFAAKALARSGRIDEALEFASSHEGWHVDGGPVASFCEQILLDANRVDEAYTRYAIVANRQSSNLATFRTIKRKYSQIAPIKILRDLIEASPGEEGKWFATAKELKAFDVAIQLASTSPCDPLTLTRASRDFKESNPDFALESGLCALRWMVKGYGYEITANDLLDAYSSTMEAAQHAGKRNDASMRIMQIADEGLRTKSKMAKHLVKLV